MKEANCSVDPPNGTVGALKNCDCMIYVNTLHTSASIHDTKPRVSVGVVTTKKRSNAKGLDNDQLH